MRTTVTLDSDVAAKLKADAHKRGVSFKEAINGNLRRALANPDPKPTRFRVNARPMGLKPGLNMDKARALADQLEDEEVLRKMALGK